MEDRCICCGEIIPEGVQVCPKCLVASKKMECEELVVSFPSKVSEADNCICRACHHLGKVVKLALPTTLYHNAKGLSTVYKNYWLCMNCREKLMNALMWGEEDGK